MARPQPSPPEQPPTFAQLFTRAVSEKARQTGWAIVRGDDARAPLADYSDAVAVRRVLDLPARLHRVRTFHSAERRPARGAMLPAGSLRPQVYRRALQDVVRALEILGAGGKYDFWPPAEFRDALARARALLEPGIAPELDSEYGITGQWEPDPLTGKPTPTKKRQGRRPMPYYTRAFRQLVALDVAEEDARALLQAVGIPIRQ